MPALVVDASVALAWALPDEISAYADAVLSVVEIEGLRVPELWLLEVANGLAVSCIRKRLMPDDEQAFLAALENLKIDVDRRAGAVAAIRTCRAAAGRYNLTAYDAVYVELAAREGLILATLDQRMRDAAVNAGVTVFEVDTASRQ